MTLVLALLMTGFQADPTDTEMPKGWVDGKRSGWDGDYPPGWKEKTADEKEEFLKKWNDAKFRYIKFVENEKGLPTGPVTAANLMLKGVNGGLQIKTALELTKFGQTTRLKVPDFTIMLKASCAVYGTEVPQDDVITLVKELVGANIRGTVLDQRIRLEILRRNQAIKEKKAQEEKEKKDNEDKDKKDGGGKK